MKPHRSLEPDALVAGYLNGGFPMDEEGARGAVGFYVTDPRTVIPLEEFRVPRSVRRALRARSFEIRLDTAFAEVVQACSGPRTGGVWLTPRLGQAYQRLHERGIAHSVEVWEHDRLVGGLFGVALGGLYTSESMFHRASDAGSAAIVATAEHLRANGFQLWDVQMTSPHVIRFGAVEIPHEEYMRRLEAALSEARQR